MEYLLQIYNDTLDVLGLKFNDGHQPCLVLGGTPTSDHFLLSDVYIMLTFSLITVWVTYVN